MRLWILYDHKEGEERAFRSRFALVKWLREYIKPDPELDKRHDSWIYTPGTEYTVSCVEIGTLSKDVAIALYERSGFARSQERWDVEVVRGRLVWKELSS